MNKYGVGIFMLLLIACSASYARDRIKLETTVIKGNKEMPQIIYIVPWKDAKGDVQHEQKLVLHSLFGNLFEPVHASDTHLQSKSSTANSIHRTANH